MIQLPSPSRPGKPLSDMTLTKVLRDCGLADRATVHGFRTAFRTGPARRLRCHSGGPFLKRDRKETAKWPA